MAGRKPTPTQIKKLMGNPGKRALNQSEPKPAKGFPARPAHLTGEARLEWDRITIELDQMGLLTTADRTVIAMYCIAWQRWVKAEKKIAETNEIVAAPKTKSPMHNPWMTIANKAHEQAARLLSEIGLTPSARSRLKLAATKDDGPATLEF